MQTPYTIRPATNADGNAIKTLVFDVLAEHGLAPDASSTDADLDDIEAHYFARGGWFEVVENSAGEIVGTVGIYRLNDDECELRKMYLSRAVRGQGLGRRLLGRSIEKAREHGFTAILLETAAPLQAAIALYKSFGFEPFDAPHLSCRCDQAFRLNLLARNE